MKIRSVQEMIEHIRCGGWIQIGGRQVNPEHIVEMYTDDSGRLTFELSNGTTRRHDPAEEGDLGDFFEDATDTGEREGSQVLRLLGEAVYTAGLGIDREVALYNGEGEKLATNTDIGGGHRSLVFGGANRDRLFLQTPDFIAEFSLDLSESTELVDRSNDLTNIDLLTRMAYRAADNSLYFVGSESGVEQHLFRLSLSGGSPVEVGTFGDAETSYGMGINEAEGEAYITDANADELVRLNLDDATAETIIAVPDGVESTMRIHYEPETDRIYYSRENTAAGIYSVRPDGTGWRLEVADIWAASLLPEDQAMIGLIGAEQVGIWRFGESTFEEGQNLQDVEGNLIHVNANPLVRE